ncbi:helicase-exonuclease AddAB subunit AddA [Allofustis seminis]|uniref:helicase-exonuclease AddAB subunit AddA n=1 Tax=Allofustis seminis TaxID=166939 RepID=UPI00036A8AF9|nr:helicase-exonuclease AddAB subunit AddA [Allofustis seminis]
MREIISTKKPADSFYTEQQWKSISTRGDNLLISASAGSGKTQVLTSRVLDHLKQGKQIDQLLIVTFTNAAAREMKERIQKDIKKAIQASADESLNQHLLHQNMKIGQAYISTIHSFCLRVIERYYYLIDFDPVFRQLTDNTEISMIKEDVWQELFEEFLLDESHCYEQFFMSYGSDSNQESIYQLVDQLYSFAMAKPNPKEWLQQLPARYHLEQGLSSSSLYIDFIKPQLLQMLEAQTQTIEELWHECEHYGEELVKTSEVLQNDFEKLSTITSLLHNDQLEEVVDATRQLKFEGWKSAKSESKEITDELKIKRDRVKENVMGMLPNYFSQPIATQEKYIQEAYHYLKTLVDMTIRFKESYEIYKRSRQLVDFNDLEQLTIQILKTPAPNYSIAAEYYQHLFFEVMVDEYQDTNEVQEEILRLITRQHVSINQQQQINEPSSFMYMVGDVKQSIYGFRQADPSLFQNKYDNYEHRDDGALITLAKNFRSRAEVLDATNRVFEAIMRKETGGIPYAGKEALQLGFMDYPENEAMHSEVMLLDMDAQEANPKLEGLSNDEKIALVMAERIHQLLAQKTQIYDKTLKQNRDVTLDDIVILTRTNSTAESTKKIFDECQIPIILSQSQNFLKTIEVTTMMAILKIIDNPIQDIPFVTVLTSAIVGLDEVELTRIRILNKTHSFYEAYQQFLTTSFIDEKNITLQKKLKDFDALLTKWRNLANKLAVSDLIREIYQDTFYNSYVLGLIGGQQRQANLQALYERAASFEKTGFKGIFRFIHFIEKIQERQDDLAEPTINNTGQPAVRVMTIHRSKGLEFPIVFLGQMDRALLKAEQRPVIMHRELGAGLTYQDYERSMRIKLWPRLIIESGTKRDELEEEMRVLYVAMTRAEQKLIMVGRVNNYEASMDEWDMVAKRADKNGLSEMDIFSAKNYLDWVIPATLAKNESALDIIEATLNPTLLIENEGATSNQNVTHVKDMDANFNEAVQNVVALIDEPYKHQPATETIPFQSVSEIKRLFEDPELEQRAILDLTRMHPSKKNVGRYTNDTFVPPKFITKEEHQLDGQQIGQIVHLILQYIDIEQAQNIEQLQEAFLHLQQRQLVRHEWLSKMPFEKISQFFQTKWGQSIIDHKLSLKREVPFSILMDASKIFNEFEPGEDRILVKGIIDGYYETSKGIVLFDYKTDRVKHYYDRAEEELKRRYRGQMNLYKMALETILNKKVIATRIISIDLAVAIELNI